MAWVATVIALGSIYLQYEGGQKAAQGQRDLGNANNQYYQELANDTEAQIGTGFATARRQVGYNTQAANKNITALTANAARDTATIERASRKTAGSQTAAFAANGVELGSATAEDVARDSFDAAALDKLAIRYNTDNKIGIIAQAANQKNWELMTQADLQAQNLKRQAANYRRAGKYGVQAANINADTTLLGSYAGIGNSIYNYVRG